VSDLYFFCVEERCILQLVWHVCGFVQGEEYELLDELTSDVNWCQARNKFGLAFAN